MFDNTLDIVKEYAKEAILVNTDISDDKKDLAFQTTSNTLVDGIKVFLAEGDFIATITEPFSVHGSSIFEKLKGSLVSNLTEKVGLDTSVASNFAASIMPSIKQVLSDKVNHFSIDVIVNAIADKENKESEGGIMDTISDFIKK